uniref:Uncharacterized protein n=1 Tax=Nelumbo nucifera TaxID=4432 RepID=A0A822YKA4_NELNU|nr:TPA_asm: hypothetical protein HUJ06_011793 [Nelumbo nucifera]
MQEPAPNLASKQTKMKSKSSLLFFYILQQNLLFNGYKNGVATKSSLQCILFNGSLFQGRSLLFFDILQQNLLNGCNNGMTAKSSLHSLQRFSLSQCCKIFHFRYNKMIKGAQQCKNCSKILGLQ